jgi:hypothetical protein
MRDLSTVRDGWDDVRRIEAELLRQKTPFETVAELEKLYREFHAAMEATESWYRPQRMQSMIELQERLQKLELWRQTHGKSG